MDQHDSFPKHFQFLQKILTLLGLFVYREELCQSINGHITYTRSTSLFIKACVYSFGPSLVTIYVCFSTLTISSMLGFVIDFVYTSSSLLLLYLDHRHFLDLLFEIEVYDRQKLICKYQGQPLHKQYFGKKVGLVFLFIFFFLVMAIIGVALVTFSNVMSDYTLLQSQLVGASSIICTNVTTLRYSVLFICYSYEIAIRYRGLHTKFLGVLKSREYGKREEVFEQYRLLYFQLSRAQSKFNKFFGFATIIFFCRAYFIILCLLMQLLSHHYVAYCLVLICKSFIEVYAVVTFAELIKKESNAMKDVLCNLPLENLSLRCQKQVHLFTLQIHLSDQDVFPVNLFRVNKQTIVSMSTSAAAFCTVMLSLVPTYRETIFRRKLVDTF